MGVRRNKVRADSNRMRSPKPEESVNKKEKLYVICMTERLA